MAEPYRHSTMTVAGQWRNDGVAVAFRDGGPSGKGAPDSFIVLND